MFVYSLVLSEKGLQNYTIPFLVGDCINDATEKLRCAKREGERESFVRLRKAK